MKNGFNVLESFPEDFYKFLLVVLFSFLIGWEQRIKKDTLGEEVTFGTDRTFTFIGILGFVLYIIQPVSLIPFIVGFVVLSMFLGVFYYRKSFQNRQLGITTIILALITYTLAPLIYTQEPWLVILLVVILLVLEEMKEKLLVFSKRMDSEELITLGKFLVMSGVILPLLPKESISTTLDFSPYKFWLAIVAISGISYASYLMKKYVFPNSGIILTGILGGLYSSTATTFILARKSKETEDREGISAAIILSTGVMFIRIFVLALIFNSEIAYKIAPALGVLFIVATAVAGILLWLKKKHPQSEHPNASFVMQQHLDNPLELKTAMIFGVLFVFLSVLTHFVTENYSENGIQILSYLVGVTDIDPFILNIFQSKYNVSDTVLVAAIINAITSNNVLKMVYALVLSASGIRKYVFFGFLSLIITGIGASFVLSYL